MEVAPAGLPNIVQNPSGYLGAWFWLTPAANTTMSSVVGANVSYLTFKTTVSQAAYFTTEPMPAIAGKYYQARIDIAAISLSHNVRLRLVWVDANGNETLATQGASANSATVYYGPYQAPTGTVYVKLRVDLYNGTGTTNAAANANVSFSGAMVTYVDTGTTVQSRTNLITNPSFETNTTGYTSGNAASISRVTSPAPVSGSYCLKVPHSGTASGSVNITPGPTVAKNTTYTVSMYVYASAAVSARLEYMGNNSGYHNGPKVTFSANTWTRYSWTFNSGTDTQINYFYFEQPGVGTGTDFYVDAVMLEKTNVVGTYFDGATTSGSGWTYSWNGTANASTSLAQSAAGTFTYNDPIQWLDITGSSAEINIQRNELDVGMATVTIYDADLDPNNYAEVRPGKQIQVTATDSAGVVTTIYQGAITGTPVVYDPTGRTKPQVTLSASDNIARLANQGENRVVANVSDLPFILEGKGVPWNVNGNTGDINSATVLAYNESASVLDEVVTTRDSNNAYAMVSCENVLTVFDTAHSPFTSGTVALSLTDAAVLGSGDVSYSDMDIEYSTDDCINQVGITFLRYNSGTGETASVSYGPYQDPVSVAKWGPHEKDFTIILPTESAANVQAFANAVLAANGTPTIKPRTATVPVVDASKVAMIAAVDLYDVISVTNTDKFDDQWFIVTGITHDITPTGWTITYTFQDSDSVATPTFVPSPPFNGVSGQTTYLRFNSTATPTMPASNSLATLTGWSGTSIANSVVSSFTGGVATISAPGTYIFIGRLSWNSESDATTRLQLRLAKNGGTQYAQNDLTPASGSRNLAHECQWVIPMAAGDTIEVKYGASYSTAPTLASTTVASDGGHEFIIYRVGD